MGVKDMILQAPIRERYPDSSRSVVAISKARRALEERHRARSAIFIGSVGTTECQIRCRKL